MSNVAALKKFGKYLLILLLLTDVIFGVAFWQHHFVKRPRVIFLDVGEGDSILIDSPGDIQILVDGGDGKDILDRLGKYMPFYDKKIELLVTTHPDKDHLGGLVEVLKYYKVEKVLETGIKCSTAICGKWEEIKKEKNVSVEHALFGQRIYANGINLNVLYPFDDLANKEVKSDNDTSVMLKVVTANNSFLLTGDAEFAEEKDLFANNINIKADILKVSHHGSKNGTSDEFLKKMLPRKGIISVGKNKYGHPAQELIGRLKNANVEIQRTDESGDIIMY